MLTEETAMDPEEYDKLSKEERDVKNKEDRAREAREQAGKPFKHLRGNGKLRIVSELPYQWRQELGDIAISVPVPKGTRARDLVVSIGKKSLSVGLKGQLPIMKGELCKEIKVDDSTWTIRK
jgi:hypothetical protein